MVSKMRLFCSKIWLTLRAVSVAACVLGAETMALGPVCAVSEAVKPNAISTTGPSVSSVSHAARMSLSGFVAVFGRAAGSGN